MLFSFLCNFDDNLHNAFCMLPLGPTPPKAHPSAAGHLRPSVSSKFSCASQDGVDWGLYYTSVALIFLFHIFLIPQYQK